MLSAIFTENPMLWLVFRELIFELGTVGHEDHFPFRERVMPVHLPHHEHHGERFARALGVPYNAAAFAAALSFDQALDRQLHGTELLISPYYLDDFALLVSGEQREGTDDVEQVVPVQHPRHEALLIVRAAATVFEIIQRARKRVRPAIKVLLAVGCDRAELCFLTARYDEELIEVKKWRTAFALGTPLLAVSKQLIYGLRDGFFHLRGFAFNHDDRQPVQESSRRYRMCRTECGSFSVTRISSPELLNHSTQAIRFTALDYLKRCRTFESRVRGIKPCTDL